MPITTIRHSAAMQGAKQSWAILASGKVALWEARQYTYYRSEEARRKISTIPNSLSVAMSANIQNLAGLEKALGALAEIAVRISTHCFYYLADNTLLTEGNILRNTHHARME